MPDKIILQTIKLWKKTNNCKNTNSKKMEILPGIRTTEWRCTIAFFKITVCKFDCKKIMSFWWEELAFVEHEASNFSFSYVQKKNFWPRDNIIQNYKSNKMAGYHRHNLRLPVLVKMLFLNGKVFFNILCFLIITTNFFNFKNSQIFSQRNLRNEVERHSQEIFPFDMLSRENLPNVVN